MLLLSSSSRFTSPNFCSQESILGCLPLISIILQHQQYTHSPSLTITQPHLLSHSFTYFLTHSLTLHSLTPSLTHTPHSLSLTHSPTTLPHSLTHSTHPSLTHSLTHSLLLHSLTPSPPHHPLTPSLTHNSPCQARLTRPTPAFA